jgi:hypothetical protein
LTGSAELQSECRSGMALFDYLLPNGSFRVAIEVMQRTGKRTYRRQILQERLIRLHIA